MSPETGESEMLRVTYFLRRAGSISSFTSLVPQLYRIDNMVSTRWLITEGSARNRSGRSLSSW
uniref:Uncharacterized protein n=1 Tax=Peronospora matthiolae TaxID=2874970 RepID=A0AAV1ULD1_9STRA